MPHPQSMALHACVTRSDEAPGVVLATVAVAVPSLLAFNQPPSATFFNQAAAIIGWAALLLWLSGTGAKLPAIRRSGGLVALLAVFAVLLLAALGSMAWAGAPSALAVSAAASIAMALLAAIAGAAVAHGGQMIPAYRALCKGLIVAGVLSAAVGLIQVFMPEWSEGAFIASPTIEGRASGNLRQPNHLSSLLLWSLVATASLLEGGLNRRLGMGLGLAFVFVLVLAGSRTGTVGVVLLGVWGVLDRRLSRSTRRLLILAPLAYLVLSGALALWAHWTHQTLGVEARLGESADSPNSRLNIWSNVLSLIARHPWTGVGFGEFNFAWSLTPFPHRPTAFFDHTHNLPLQLAVELGLPLTMLLLALLAYALWRAHVAGREAAQHEATLLRAAFMMVLMMAVHSLFEYPLWYAYFLLPTAFLWGLCLGDRPSRPSEAAAHPETPSRPRLASVRPLVLAALVMFAGGVASVLDYLRVAAIFKADEGAAPLAQRIASGQRSWFFAHHAHYAAATTAARPSEVMGSFKVATHYLLDTRLMIAWAKALNERGDVERARHIAERLREFRNEDSKAFFSPCGDPATPAADKPFQCMPPTKPFDFRDFR